MGFLLRYRLPRSMVSRQTNASRKLLLRGTQTNFHVSHVLLLSLLSLTFLAEVKGDWSNLLSGLVGDERVESFQEPKVEWNEIVKRETRPLIKSKWIVAVTSGPPTKELIEIASLPDWQLLVLGDPSTPSDWHVESAIYLNYDGQKQLNYRVCDSVFEGRHVQLNIGYLFAIESGAKIIYTAQDENQLINKDLDTAFGLNSDGSDIISNILVYSSSPDREVVNPFVHFGQASVWPRGLPLVDVGRNHQEKHYQKGVNVKVPIRQGLTNGNSDSLDSVFRLTRATRGVQVSVTFDSCSHPMAVPAGTMVPTISHNVIFHREAFWAMMLPPGLPHRVADIWRGYWAQRLLFDLGGNVAYFPPITSQNMHTNVTDTDLQSESLLYTRTTDLIHFLLNWESTTSNSLFDRAIELSFSMTANSFWTKDDTLFSVAWLSDLISVGYEPPELTKTFSRNGVLQEESTLVCGSKVLIRNLPSSYLGLPESNFPDTSLSSCPIGTSNGLGDNEISINTEEQVSCRPIPSVSPFQESQQKKEVLSKLPAFIPPSVITSIPSEEENALLESWRDYYSDIVLVINYNTPKFHESVNFWRAIYGRVFTKIHVLSSEGDQEWGVQNVENAYDGWLSYRALPSVFSQYPEAKGFLITNDDLILNYWNLVGSDKSRIWFSKLVNLTDMTTVVPNRKDWSTMTYHIETLLKGLATVPKWFIDRFNEFLSKALPYAPGTDPEAIIRTLKEPPPVRGYVKWLSDTYYIPMRLTNAISEVIPHFVNVDLRSEIAIPMFLHGADNPEFWDPLALQNVTYLWGADRNDPWTTYSTKLDGYHPWKTSSPRQMRIILEAMMTGDPTLKALHCSICHFY